MVIWGTENSDLIAKPLQRGRWIPINILDVLIKGISELHVWKRLWGKEYAYKRIWSCKIDKGSGFGGVYLRLICSQVTLYN